MDAGLNDTASRLALVERTRTCIICESFHRFNCPGYASCAACGVRASIRYQVTSGGALATLRGAALVDVDPNNASVARTRHEKDGVAAVADPPLPDAPYTKHPRAEETIAP